MAQGHATITATSMRSRGYLLVSEAARKIEVAPQTLYRWVAAGKVDGFRDGFRRYVRWSSVLKHLGAQSARIRGLAQDDIWAESDAA